MTGEELRAAIKAALESHPGIVLSNAGHNAYALRYTGPRGAPIGLEPRGVRHQNIWVRAADVRLNRLADIRVETYDHRDYAASKPNHDLFHDDAFLPSDDLVCFKVTDLWQAVRIIVEVAGTGSAI